MILIIEKDYYFIIQGNRLLIKYKDFNFINLFINKINARATKKN
ncbi:hypothetical protein SAMN05421847_0391 [Halpernia humi]|uniref:Uncharacterized protein n=1 Tax=Halpernia humi TaxID=493375 RepID=A0A1H5T7K6_9FLAO|nr:hypothetical protein SAMN05421847_0391 [Halpernia humi]